MLCNHGNSVAYCGCDFSSPEPSPFAEEIVKDVDSVPEGFIGAVLVHFHDRVAEIGIPRAAAGHYLMWCPQGVKEMVTKAARVGIAKKAEEKLANVLNVCNCKGLRWEVVRVYKVDSLEEVKTLRHKGQWARKCACCQGK